MDKVYDLVIIGGGCVGMASAYYALQRSWTVCIIDSGTITEKIKRQRFNFSAHQNHLQNNEEYLTKFVIESNKEWKFLEKQFSKGKKNYSFLHQQGVLWFGDKTVSTKIGNIKAANTAFTLINSAAKKKDDKIESLYIEKIMEGIPSFMKAFKPYNSQQNSLDSEWDAWSGLYQPDGGSIDVKTSYECFHQFAVDNHVKIFENTIINDHHSYEPKGLHYFNVIADKVSGQISGRKVLITVGVETPYFLKKSMNEPYLLNNAINQYQIREYAESYMKINTSDGSAEQIYRNLPSFVNFINKTQNIIDKQKQYSAYGFGYHDWDNLDLKSPYFIKMGTFAYNKINDLKQISYEPITDKKDPRILAAQRYAEKRMQNIIAKDPQNKHYPYPVIFYEGRETILDYLNRTDESIVVQSGGVTGKYYPLLAKTAIMMLADPDKAHGIRSKDSDVYGSFINRTRFPITFRVKTIMSEQVSLGKTHFEQAVIGGGCTGIYAAYRLNKQKHKNPQRKQQIGNIGLFELSDRISGRLKSFKFKGTSTPMQMGGMRYIPTNHVLVNKIITDLGIPSVVFGMQGDPIQNAARLCYLRNDYYRMDQWSATQASKTGLHTSYKIEGVIVGMNASQIMSFSLYMILTAPENINLLTQVFLEKTIDQVQEQKKKLAILGDNVHAEDSYYRDWKNYIYRDLDNKKNYNTNLSLKQWNKLKPILLFRFRYPVEDEQVYKTQKTVPNEDIYPLYKFGFQNVIQAQFGNEAYQFVAEQNGYLSNTSNASYLDQMMAYLLDFGDVSYRTLASGYDQICYAMANVLLGGHQGLDKQLEGMFLNHKLVDILPGTTYGKKYELVFHVSIGVSEKLTHHLKTINHLKKIGGSQLGKLIPIEGNPGYGQIRFTADNVILGMPRKSVTILANEISLLRKSIEENYDEIYNRLKLDYYEIFKYNALEESYAAGQQLKPLTQPQQKMLKYLQDKQEYYFEHPQQKNELSFNQKRDLNYLSNIKFLKSLQDLTTTEKEYELNKIKKFNQDQPIQPKDIFQLAESAQLMPAMKVCMNFDRSWWNPDPTLNKQYQKTYKNTTFINSSEEMRGVSVTDLPLRQTLYFSQGSDNVLLASYNDMVNTQFWTTLHDNFKEEWKPKKTQMRTILGKNPQLPYPPSMDIHRAKKVLVKEILKQLSLLHQIDVKEEWLRECVYQFWGRDPYGAAYHNFLSGYYIPAVMKTMRRPWRDENIFIVGEAFSNETGWVEGAFQTTELLLQDQFGLPELVKGYYAGY